MRVTFATLPTGDVPPMGILYVSAALKKAGHQTRVIEALTKTAFLDALERTPSDIVAFSVTTGLHRIYLEWAKEAKKRFGLPTLFGGSHPTFFPEIAERDEVDAIVIGEGEYTTPQLLEALQARDARSVEGAIYRHNGVLVRGALRAPEQDLDRLEAPDRRLYYDLNPANRDFPVKAFLASRGCPFRCSYCFNRSLNDMYRGSTRSVRYRTPQSVIDEILEVRAQWPMKLVWFLDANFVVSRDWVADLSDRLRKQVGLPFYCKVRPNLIDASLAKTLARGGCTGAGIGIESGDDDLRNRVLERNLSRERIVAACHHLKAAGIRIMSFNMVGLPGETYEQAKSTVDLNIEAKVDYAMVTVLQPYPRTVLAERAQKAGLFHGDIERIDTNYYSSIQMKEIVPGDRKRIENLQRLFDLAVQFPLVRKNIDWLVQQNHPSFYKEVFKRWHGKCFRESFYENLSNPMWDALRNEHSVRPDDPSHVRLPSD